MAVEKFTELCNYFDSTSADEKLSIYAKLAEAEGDICAGRTMDARCALNELRARYGL